MQNKSKFYETYKCTFGIGNTKKESLRGQLFKKLGIDNSLTIETSFYGYLNRDNKLVHWTETHFRSMAHSVL